MGINEGTTDRLVRVVAGAALVTQAFVGLHTPWAWLGLVPLATGALGVCPVYSLFGWSTCRVEKKAA